MTNIFKRLSEKTILILFFLASIYGFFVFHIESLSGKLTVRIIIILIFLIIIYFRYLKSSNVKDGDEKSKQDLISDKKDIEIISRLGDEFHIQKKNMSEENFESYLSRIVDIIQSTFIASSVVYLFDQGENKLVPKGVHFIDESKVKDINIDEEIVS